MFKDILIIIIFLKLVLFINSEKWFPAVTDYNTDDHDNGYAGSSNAMITDFYLCGKDTIKFILWETIKQNGLKSIKIAIAGGGRIIDAITVDGDTNYQGRIHKSKNWGATVTGFNITNEEFVGEYCEPLACIAVTGGDLYRVAYTKDLSYNDLKSSNQINVTNRVLFVWR